MTRRGYLARSQEERSLKQRAKDIHRDQVVAFYTEQRTYDAQARSMERCQAIAAKREALEAEHAQQQAGNELKSHKIQETARVAAQCEAQKAATEEAAAQEAFTEKKITQVILDSSSELKELRKKLAAAEVDYCRRRQMEMATAGVRQAEELDMQFNQADAEIRSRMTQQEKQSQLARRQKALDVHPLAERGNLQRAAKEEVVKERDAVQQLVQRAHEARQQEAEAAVRKKRNLREEAEAFAAIQRQLKARQREAEADEERKIAEYMRLRREREEREAAAKAQQRRESEDQYWEERRKIEEEQARLEEEEALLDLLRADMERQRAERAAQEQAQRLHQQRQEMKEFAEYATKLKADRLAAEAASEAAFRHRLMERLAEEDQMAARTTIARKQRMAAHVKETERCVVYRRKLQQALEDEEQAHEAKAATKEQERLALVAAERHRLLQASAHVLKGHAPKGVIESEEELVMVLKAQEAVTRQ